MADSGLPVNNDALGESLTRLAKKPGVRATIALDRNTGAILQTSGEISFIRTSRTIPSSSGLPNQGGGGSFSSDANGDTPSETQGVEELSALVWNFVKVAGAFVDEVDRDDELKLLRLRTKKQELVIVPDPKFLLIAIHDTPPA